MADAQVGDRKRRTMAAGLWLDSSSQRPPEKGRFRSSAANPPAATCIMPQAGVGGNWRSVQAVMPGSASR